MKTFIPNRRSIDFYLDMRLCRRRKKPSAEETKHPVRACAIGVRGVRERVIWSVRN